MIDKRTAPALARGAAVGLIISVGAAILMYLMSRSVGDGEIVSPVFVALVFLPWLAPGIAAGVTAHVLLLRTGWAPRLTWLMLTAFFMAASFLAWIIAILLSGAFYTLMASFIQDSALGFDSNSAWTAAQIIIQIVQAIIAFGLWFFLATFGLRKTLTRPDEDDKRASQTWPLVAGQLGLALFVAASWLPGMGTLILGTTIGLSGMLILAVLATGRRDRGTRTPAFLLRAWSTPLVTMLGVVIVIALEARSLS